VLSVATYFVEHMAHGLKRQWHDNGVLARVELHRYGVTERWRTWNRDGQPDDEWRISTDESDAQRLERARKRNAEVCDREPLPAEFRLDAYDWDAAPTVQPAPPVGHNFPPRPSS
jgi:hypothetical protein